MTLRKTILITGASSGLGEGMAREWAAKGRNLALCARRVDRLEALQAELLGKYPGIRVSVKALDVNNHADVFAIFDAFAAELGPIDRVVVNAGTGKGQPLGTGYFAANAQTARTNFVAALAQCEAAMTRLSGSLSNATEGVQVGTMPLGPPTLFALSSGIASPFDVQYRNR